MDAVINLTFKLAFKAINYVLFDTPSTGDIVSGIFNEANLDSFKLQCLPERGTGMADMFGFRNYTPAVCLKRDLTHFFISEYIAR